MGDVEVVKQEGVSAEEPIMGADAMRVALSGDCRHLLFHFKGVCLHCEDPHEVEFGYVAVAIDMAPSIRDAIASCWKRASQ